MAAAYRSHSTLSLGTRTNSTFAAPSGIQNGDTLLILISAGQVPAIAVTPPAGFATCTGFPLEYGYSGDTWKVRLYAFWKVAASESGSYTCTHSSGSSEGVMYAVSGGHATTPINPNPTTQIHTTETTGSTLTAPSITPAVADSFIAWFGGTWDDFGNDATPATGFTERYNPTSGSVLYVADGVFAAAATGTVTVTSTQQNGLQNACAMVCVEAAVGGGGGGTILPMMNAQYYGGPS
jgi:hypothetical protein